MDRKQQCERLIEHGGSLDACLACPYQDGCKFDMNGGQDLLVRNQEIYRMADHGIPNSSIASRFGLTIRSVQLLMRRRKG